MNFEFFTEKEQPQSEATPTLANVFKNARTAGMADMRVALPAEVVKYDYKKQKADVKPLLKRKYQDNTVVEMPVIYNVPVIHPRSGSAYVHMPLKKGHNVMLVFQDRSIDKWLSTGGNVDPEDVRMHHLSDAVAYPGLYPFNDVADVNNGDDVIVKNGIVEMRIKPNNHFQVINSQHEFVAVMDELVKTIREAVVYTSTGAQPLRHSNFAIVHAKLKTFKES